MPKAVRRRPNGAVVDSQRRCSLSSERTTNPSLPRKRESSLFLSLVLLPPNPLTLGFGGNPLLQRPAVLPPLPLSCRGICSGSVASDAESKNAVFASTSEIYFQMQSSYVSDANDPSSDAEQSHLKRRYLPPTDRLCAAGFNGLRLLPYPYQLLSNRRVCPSATLATHNFDNIIDFICLIPKQTEHPILFLAELK